VKTSTRATCQCMRTAVEAGIHTQRHEATAGALAGCITAVQWLRLVMAAASASSTSQCLSYSVFEWLLDNPDLAPSHLLERLLHDYGGVDALPPLLCMRWFIHRQALAIPTRWCVGLLRSHSKFDCLSCPSWSQHFITHVQAAIMWMRAFTQLTCT
jgi:hypothetical protein